MGDLSKNFSRWEFACKCGCGFDTVDYELLNLMEHIREEFGPTTIISGCRCAAHNATIPTAASDSQHIYGRAADFVTGVAPKTIQKWLENNFPNSLGIGSYLTATHVDTKTGRGRRW